MRAPRVTSTPVGASALAAAVVTILMSLLGLWHWWAEVPTATQNAVQTVLTAVAVYLAGWRSIVKAPGQTVNLELTSSPLPTVQNVPATEGSPQEQAVT